MLRALAALLLILLLGWAAPARAQPMREVQAYNPYPTPPFVTAEGGLAADVVAYLNAQGGPFHFVLQTVPKARLLQLVHRSDASFGDLVLFQMPVFMDDPDATLLAWGAALFADHDVLVFARPPQRRIERPQDLAGLRLGGVRGHRYRSLDAVVASGVLAREDAGDVVANLRKLALGRIDVTQMTASELAFHAAALGQEFHSQPGFEASVLRQWAVGRADPGLKRWLEGVQQRMPRDPAWRALLQRYRLAPA